MPAPALDLPALQDRLTAARSELRRHIIGQDRVIDLTLTTLLAGGHGLMMGVPGLAKTRLVEMLGKVMGLSAKRIQCTPDLLPGDVLGSEVLDQDENGRRSFRFIHGPIFAELVMIDEINRASPRTQSAFLQAMQEHEVTVSGQTYPLPAPFHVLATQNPIEQDGTYSLPEAQLDRFLMQIDITWPDRAAEKEILKLTTTGQREDVQTLLSSGELRELQSWVAEMPIGEAVVEAILTLVRRARPDEEGSLPEVTRALDWAPGIRASQALMLATRAKALLEGRAAPSVDDVLDLAPAVLQHRLRLTPQARAEGITAQQLIAQLGAGL